MTGVYVAYDWHIFVINKCKVLIRNFITPPSQFQDPQPPDSWSGVRDATKPGNRCAQMNPFAPVKWEGSEDCLYLNVYTPVLPAERIEKLPVLFFVHGGRYVLGYGDYYRPDYFLQHDVVIVTINYRLHILGFLCLHTEEVPGNAGLKDAVLALRWVNRNISSFNGDKSNITVFGESSGGATVSCFLTSKMAQGLFSKMIVESSASLSDLLMVEEDKIGKVKFIGEQLGKETDDMKELFDFLQSAPVEDLLKAICVAELSKEEINAFFLPVVEKSYPNVEPFMTEYPLQTFKANNHVKVPILAGLCSHEGAFFLPKDSDGSIIFNNDLRFYIPRYLFIPKESRRAKDFASSLRQFYFGDKEIGQATKEQYLDLVSDAYFNRDVYIKLDILARHQDEVYFYMFPYTGGMSTRVMKGLGVKGACHGDILQYQFYRKNKHETATETDRKVVIFLSEAWCNFAKNG